MDMKSHYSGRQNKIYIDVSKEKYKLDCSEVARLNDMVRLKDHLQSGSTLL